MAKGKRLSEPIPPGSNHIRLELNDDHHAKLRVLAAQAGVSMAAYVRSIVVRVIEELSGSGKKGRGK